MMDNVSYFQGSAQALAVVKCPNVSTASLSKARGGGLKGHTGLPAQQPVPCLSRSCVGGEGLGHLVYKYTWSPGNCAT